MMNIQEPDTETNMPVAPGSEQSVTTTGPLSAAATRRPARPRKPSLVPASAPNNTPAPAPAATVPTTKKEPNSALAALKNPWVILGIILGIVFFAVLVVAGFWLVLNPSFIRNNSFWAGPVTVGSIIAGVFIWGFSKAIIAGCKTLGKAIKVWAKQPGSGYWVTIWTFLIVSVAESGVYFNEIIGATNALGALGYAVALVNDLIAVQCMRARLNANRLHDQAGARLYLLGVIASAGLSAWANTYTSLSHYHAPTGATLLPWFMTDFAPWTAMAFPLMIIFLSFAADYTADQSGNRLDADEYERQENNKNRILEIRAQKEEERLAIHDRMEKARAKTNPAEAARKAHKEALQQARRAGEIEREHAKAARGPFRFGAKPAPQSFATQPGTQEPAPEKKAKAKVTGGEETAIQTSEVEGDVYDPKELIQIIGGKPYHLVRVAAEQWNLPEDKLRSLATDHPDLVKWTFVFVRGGQSIPMISAHPQARKDIKAVIPEKRARRTGNTAEITALPRNEEAG